MAELVDALVSGTSGSDTLEVRIFLCPPYVWKRVYGVVAQLVERCVRNAEVVSSNLISSTTLRIRNASGGKQPVFAELWKTVKRKSWGYGGMVDAEDLKSFDHCDRVGSSPTIPTKTWFPQRRIFYWKFSDVWLSWLEHYVHIVGVGGSSPPTSTKKNSH